MNDVFRHWLRPANSAIESLSMALLSYVYTFWGEPVYHQSVTERSQPTVGLRDAMPCPIRAPTQPWIPRPHEAT